MFTFQKAFFHHITHINLAWLNFLWQGFSSLQPTLKTLYIICLGLTLSACIKSPYTQEQQSLLNHYKDGKEKRGQVYFQQVCSKCHQDQYQIEVPPKERTMAQWHQILTENTHHEIDYLNRLSDFYSLAYREQLAQKNEVVALFLGLSTKEIELDVGKYILNGAKDSDNPKSCN